MYISYGFFHCFFLILLVCFLERGRKEKKWHRVEKWGGSGRNWGRRMCDQNIQ